MCSLSEEDLDTLAEQTQGFRGADIQSLCQDAAMGPIRDLKAQFGHVEDSGWSSARDRIETLQNCLADGEGVCIPGRAGEVS